MQPIDMTNRKNLRAATVGKAKDRLTTKIVIDGYELEVRQPTVRKRSAIVNSGQSEGRTDMGQILASAIIECVYDPVSGEPVYDEADRESLLEQPTGSFVDTLGNEVLRLMNVEAPKVGKH